MIPRQKKWPTNSRRGVPRGRRQKSSYNTSSPSESRVHHLQTENIVIVKIVKNDNYDDADEEEDNGDDQITLWVIWWEGGNGIFIGPRCPWGLIYGSRGKWVTMRGFWNSTDVTLADEDTKSIPTDNANKAIPGNVAIHGGQIWNQCKCCHLVTRFETNSSGAFWW